MSTLSSGKTEPKSSSELPTFDAERVAEIDHKHQVISEFIEAHGCDALLLQKASNFAWFTSGGASSRGDRDDTTAGLFITPDARVVICSNVDSGQIFDREIPGLGFQLKERPWHEPKQVLVDDICRGRAIASDVRIGGQTLDASVYLSGMRLPLTALECERMRELGQMLVHSIEATARHFRQGTTEAEIAGELAHRLIKRQVTPERIQVWADGQGKRNRHWGFGSDRVEHYCVISVVGRRAGLCVGAARTACFNDPPKVVSDAHRMAMMIQATGMFFSKADWEVFETWNRAQRIYEKFGVFDEWQLAEQAEVIGYEICEAPIVPKSEFRLAPRMAVYWHPSIGPAMVGDTILVGKNEVADEPGFELLTPTEGWPQMEVTVKGMTIYRPDILRREA